MTVLACVFCLLVGWIITTKVSFASTQRKGIKGSLHCEGKRIDSEVIYWRDVPGDSDYISPLRLHNAGEERYLTFDYTHGGWNNIRMDFESIMVLSHATGRTLVLPPRQSIYLLKDHKSKQSPRLDFSTFYNINHLHNQIGIRTISMKEFLYIQSSHHHPINPNTTGRALWAYLERSADIAPSLFDRFFTFLSNYSARNQSAQLQRYERFRKQYLWYADEDQVREPIHYNETFQRARHIHIRGDGVNCILQHHYAFTYFEDPSVSSFYKRFIRDYLRYKDAIHCKAHQIIKQIRHEATELNPRDNGNFYALHIRRGDLQFKKVKISAQDIVSALTSMNGTSMIPRGAYVYISTDDPAGLCAGCKDDRGRLCSSLWEAPLPIGCMQDTTWEAFIKAGWNIRFLRDFIHKGLLNNVSSFKFGIMESIICSRAILFAGTYLSTFTGYIHRLRGYAGLGEDTYYHTPGMVSALRNKRSVGSGWAREWRTGWTDDDEGRLI